ncbi:MAG: ABC transporter permease subunit [Alicyclobacillus herbarius]|uniref:ABC transporter permease subunit n=1 Tax=Alicyclobacillus herbarius TaxID=122960 RepID=UPI002353BEA8|nr:ABC transporter permease subunit [Alicyclobacillus herbarius]MCL6631015.1 ABC transporter permease subunit [Alicyclobacillus herbarius]
MLELWRVYQNEWMKLLRRRRLWVAGLLGVAMIALFVYKTYHDHQNQLRYDSLTAWQQQLTMDKQELSQLQKEGNHSDTASGPGGNADAASEIQMLKDNIRRLQEQIAEVTESDAKWQRVQAKSVKDEQANLKQQLAQPKPSNALQSAQQSAGIAQTRLDLLQATYRLEHHIRPLPTWSQTPYDMVRDFLGFTAQVFLPLLAVILTADFVSGEATSGTIKLLLVRPVPRWKVLLGKWLVALTATAALTVGLCGVVWLIGCLQYGATGGRQPQVVGLSYAFQRFVSPDGGTDTVVTPLLSHAHILPMWAFTLAAIGLTALAMMVVATIAFVCTTCLKSAMASTAAALGAVVIGFIVTQFLQGSHWVAFLFPTHLNLAADWTGSTATQLTLTVSLLSGLGTLFVWGGLSILGAFIYFVRRDVLNA